MSQSTCEFASASDWWNLTGGIEKVTHSNIGDWI